MRETTRASAVALLGRMRILGGFEEAAGKVCLDCEEEEVVGSGLLAAFALRVVRGAISRLN